MHSSVVHLSLLLAAILVWSSSAAPSWISPLCNGCCSYTAAVSRPLSIPLHAVRANGSATAVTIYPQEDPGLPVGSVLEHAASNSSLALATFTMTPLSFQKNLSMVFYVRAAHEGAVLSMCLRVSVLAPEPFYIINSSTGSASQTLNSDSMLALSAAVNCPVSITVAVEDAFYGSIVRVSRLRSVSPTGTVTSTIPDHVLQMLPSATRYSITLNFVPVLGSESSTFMACFIGGDVLGMRQLPEVCATWTVSKCEYCSASGETLQYISQMFSGDSNWRRLFNMNPSLVDPDLIFTDNKRLVIGNLYRISRGDTLVALSQRFRCSLPSLLRLNPDISDPSSINVGQQLCVAPHTLLQEVDARLGAKV